MPSARLRLREADVVRLSLEFLHNRELHISQLSLERETGIINGLFSDDVLFLRQLILDGQWDDVLEFIQPLEALPAFDLRQFTYLILRHKYVELLCIKSEASGLTENVDSAVSEVVQVLHELEKVCASKEEHSNLCLLLTLPRLSDHLNYKDWNPSNARVQCFRQVYPLVEKFLPSDKKSGEREALSGAAKNDRLIQLLIKGILYESCVKYCQVKATGEPETPTQDHEMTFSRLLDGCAGLSDSDLSLLSWLQSIPPETFSIPFEQRSLNVDVERLERPSLETSWTEHMLVTPIKPKTFPHSAMPFTRPKSAADMMSRSLLPALDQGPAGTAPGGMALSTGDLRGSPLMSRSSFASFHLTGAGVSKNKLMNTSVDRLFENEGDVFVSSTYGEFQLPSISENTSTPKRKSPERKSPSRKEALLSTPSTPEHGRGRESPSTSTSTSTTARSSRRDSLSLSERPHPDPTSANPAANLDPSRGVYDQGDLFKEFQRTRQRLQEKEILLRQYSDPRFSDSQRMSEDSFRSNSSRTNSALVNSNSVPNSNSTVVNSNGRIEPPDAHYDTVKPLGRTDLDGGQGNGAGRARFMAITSLEDVQAVRCAEFHPRGNVYAVGSNSKTLRICAYPKISDISEDSPVCQPTVLFKRTRHHKGSIYCMAWTPIGDLMATGSNDKTVKLMRFNAETSNLEGQEIELAMHDGTVRDLCFLEDTSNKSSLLISGGAGDCKIYVTDCATGQAYQALSGHSGHVLSLYNWGGAMFVSGSQDRTVRFWDLRTRGCVNVITPVTVPGTKQGSAVAAVCVDPSGRLLVSGHEDSACVLWDIRGARTLQCFKPHSADVRSIRFSPSAYYLLTAGYDNRLVLTDLQGDLTAPLPSVVVAQHQDKVISGRWHPQEFSFLSTSADKTVTLWALPPV
nr:PREDICTED: WD repeat-containing protein 47 isoform X1 [Bemisia tabaci]XP_018911984.1 PREDICTED: WD repeat-containing protein 47 isoform X1 [Bemisia tabaci]XP_018911985.1 PREDICTED: WD repeat-containing protein 47 isoform X1 [Bemisia tabaci]